MRTSSPTLIKILAGILANILANILERRIMTTSTNSFGPWTTSLGNGSRMELSAFWSQRMNALASLAIAPRTTRRSAILIGATAVALVAAPLIDFHAATAVAQEAPAAVPLDQLATRAAPPTEAERSAMQAAYRQARELEQELAKSHGYRLEPEELIKFVPAEQGGDVRQKLAKLHAGEREMMMRFHQHDGELTYTGANYGGISLARLIEVALGANRQRIEADSAILDTLLTGDLIFAGPYEQEPAPPTETFHLDEDLAKSLGRTLSAARKRPLTFEVRQVERPVLVARGSYRFTPIPDEKGNIDAVTGRVAEQADGTFQFPARRDSTSMSVGSFKEFLEDVGRLLLLPIVDEIEGRPTKPSYFWAFASKAAVEGQTPLGAATSDAVIAALATQTGLTFTHETRPIQILFIGSEGEAAADAAK